MAEKLEEQLGTKLSLIFMNSGWRKRGGSEDWIVKKGVQGGGRALLPPLCVPTFEAEVAPIGGGSFNITSASISLPQARHSGVPRGGRSLLNPKNQRHRKTSPIRSR